MSYCSFYNGLFNVGNKSTITLHDSITHLFFSFSGMNITESNRNYMHMPNIVQLETRNTWIPRISIKRAAIYYIILNTKIEIISKIK